MCRCRLRGMNVPKNLRIKRFAQTYTPSTAEEDNHERKYLAPIRDFWEHERHVQEGRETMIWRCPGCGAGFPNMQNYEQHAIGCIPLHHGEAYRDRKQKNAESRPRSSSTHGEETGTVQPRNYESNTRHQRKGERGRPKETKDEEPRVTI